MTGLRIISPSLTPQTELTEGLKVLVDKTGYSQARSLDVKFLGNSLIQGKALVGDPWGSVSNTSNFLRISTDGGNNWSQDFGLPSGVGIVSLLSSLTGDDRLHIDAIRGTEGLVNPSQYDFLQLNTSATITGHSTGRMYWDDNDKTVSIDTDITGVSLNLGQEQYIRVRNTTGSNIPNGRIVYINGVTGQVPTISLANAGDSSKSRLIGLVTEDISNNGFGYVTTFGIVRNINTLAFTEGQYVYLSTTDGLFTATPPTKPNFAIKIGVCLYSHGTHGKILVDIGLDWSNKASAKDLNINGLLETNDIITDSTKYHYFGESDVDGSWRMGISDNNFVIEKREAGTWVTKSTINA